MNRILIVAGAMLAIAFSAVLAAESGAIGDEQSTTTVAILDYHSVLDYH